MSAAAEAREQRSRFRAFLLGVALPAVIASAGTTLLVLWLPRFPERIVRQWDFQGNPTTTMEVGWLWVIPALFTGIGLGLGVWHARGLAPDGGYGPDARTAIALAPAFTLVGWVLGLGGAAVQLEGSGIANPSLAMVYVVLATFVGAGALFALGRRWLPKSRLPRQEPHTPVALPRAERQHLVWSERIGIPRVLMVLLLAGPVVTLAIAVALGELGSLAIVLPVLLAGLTLYLVGVWRVTCDRSGLTVRHPLGWPSIRVPIAEIAEVRSAEVHALSEYGGFGYRRASERRSGVIVRSGPGIEVTRTNGSRFVVTCADAEIGASVLESYRQYPDTRGARTQETG